MNALSTFWLTVPVTLQIVIQILAIVLPLALTVAYLTLAERKVIGYMQARIGPNRVGPRGLLQPIADGIKLLMKEVIIPTGASRALFIIGPILSLAPALIAWAVIPFDSTLVLADINAGLLSMAITDPVDDLRGDREYKTAMTGQMVKRAIRAAAARAV